MPRTLLAVLAHPDDESFGPGGTLARYAGEGADVHIAIATDGAAGSVVEEFESKRAELAAIRRQELESAVDILGGTLHQFNYRDSGYVGDTANEHPDAFMNVDEEEAAGRVVALIRALRPQVIITHDETGGYFHPDHIMANIITVKAFHTAGDPEQYPHIGPAPYQPQRLYYSAFPSRYLKLFTFTMRMRGQNPTKVGRNQDIDLTKLGRPNQELHARINTFHYWDVQQRASAEHRSQGGGVGFANWMPLWLQRRIFSTDYFIRAYPPPADDGKQKWETDLFAGIDG